MNEFVVTINGKKKNVKILKEDKVILGDKIFNVMYSKVNDYLYLVKVENRVYEITTNKLNELKYRFGLDGYYTEVEVRTTLQEMVNDYLINKSKNIINDSINAPMPGLILKFCKKEGEVVKKGESLLILEAMKMENEIRSPVDGIIKEIFKKEGSSVEKGEIILTLE
jgi:biotin carboxyl carrier protein